MLEMGISSLENSAFLLEKQCPKLSSLLLGVPLIIEKLSWTRTFSNANQD